MRLKVSIITPLHNKGSYVAETIQSVLEQTMTDWEMIIVENGSTDSGPEVVLQFDDPRIRLVVSTKLGPGAARNFGLNHATGEWILFLDADDLIMPGYLKEQIRVADVLPDANIVAGCWQEFDGESIYPMAQINPSGYRRVGDEVEQSAIAFAPWALHAAIVKRSRFGGGIRWFEDLDGYPSEDTAFWFSVIQGAMIAWSDSSGALYRTAILGSRNASPCSERWFYSLKKVIKKNQETLLLQNKGISSKQCAVIMRTYESRYQMALRSGNQSAADLFLEEAERWLTKCEWNEISLVLRKLVGIRIMGNIRKFQ